MNPVKSTTKKSTQKPAKGLTAEERAALKERLKEEKAERETRGMRRSASMMWRTSTKAPCGQPHSR
jgi:hypothetical protein